MGAANVLKVYHSWSHLDDRPFRLLAYMALRARDRDADPWYGAGHTELAQMALGLPVATERERAAGQRIARRAMTQLRNAGAIETVKVAVRGRHARYRLYLNGPAQVTQRPAYNSPDSHERRSPTDLRSAPSVGHSATCEHQYVGHSVADRRSLSDLPTEEKEEEVLQKQERSSSKANLRNGELWKADPPHPNGSAEPATHATPETTP